MKSIVLVNLFIQKLRLKCAGMILTALILNVLSSILVKEVSKIVKEILNALNMDVPTYTL
jgi:hypothetical protein